MITTIIFDFYDVIRIDPYKKWLADHGYKREGEFYDAAAKYDRGLSSFEELMEDLSALSGQSASEIDAAFKASTIFDDDVVELIRSLKSNYKIGLLSNAGGPGLRNQLLEKQIIDLFSEIIISGEVGFIKPEHEIFKVALQRLDCNPEESVFIDDNPHNVQAGQEVGINSIIFTGINKLQSDLQVLGVEIPIL